MKIIDPDTQTLTPQGQMWIGVTGSLAFLLGGILAVTKPMATLDQIRSYLAFSSVPFMAWVGWRGYRRQSLSSAPKEPSK